MELNQCEFYKVFTISLTSLSEIMKASQQAIERGVKDCVFIDYKRRSGHFDVTTVASIKEITEKVNSSLSDQKTDSDHVLVKF